MLGDLSHRLSVCYDIPDNSKNTDAPKECGDSILQLGWRQGSLIPKGAINLPDKCKKLAEDAQIIVCSQSCTVVRPNFETDPFVELIIGTPVEQFKPNSSEATGKNQRMLHLKVLGLDTFKALGISINHKFEIPRHILLDIEPVKDISLENGEDKKLSSWLGRNYTRIALPDNLVKKLKDHLYAHLITWLKTKISPDNSTLYSNVDCIYVSWTPDEEADQYTLKMKIIAKTDAVVKGFYNDFFPKIEPLTNDNALGFKLICDCMEKSDIFLSDLDGYRRFSEYDYFTQMGEWQGLYDT